MTSLTTPIRDSVIEHTHNGYSQRLLTKASAFRININIHVINPQILDAHVCVYVEVTKENLSELTFADLHYTMIHHTCIHVRVQAQKLSHEKLHVDHNDGYLAGKSKFVNTKAMQKFSLLNATSYTDSVVNNRLLT